MGNFHLCNQLFWRDVLFLGANHDWSAMDEVTNQWDNGNIGNYWDDYIDKNPDAISIDGIWDTPYNITGGSNMDRFPLVNP